MHGAERVEGSIALVAGELHRGVELVSRPVGEWKNVWTFLIHSFIVRRVSLFNSRSHLW